MFKNTTSFFVNFKKKLVFANIFSLPSIYLSNGSLEALKWLALICMLIDHSNRFLTTPFYGAYAIGRIAMPLFAFILAYNFARPGILTNKFYLRISSKLIFFGIIAQPAYAHMLKLIYWQPLNILFTLLTATSCIFMFNQSRIIFGIVIFIIGQLFVEYSFPGIFLCLGFWFYCKRPNLINLLLIMFGFFLLNTINANNWALLSILLIFLGTSFNLSVKRIPNFFYIFYPAHLYILWAINS